MISAGGRTFPIGLTTTTIDDGTPEGTSATVIFQDISDNKRLEELRLRAERLEAVAELSASLAHEIKNPLASIRSAVEQLARRPKANEDERILGKLVVRESDRLARLLSEFLDFARVRVTARRARGHGRHRAAPRRSSPARTPTAAPASPSRCDRAAGAALRRRGRGPAPPCRVQHRAQRRAGLAGGGRGRRRGRAARRGAGPDGRALPRATPSPSRVTDDGAGIPLEIRDRHLRSRSSPRSPAAPASDCRSSTAPSKPTAASSSWTAPPPAPASPSCCRSARRPRTRNSR